MIVTDEYIANKYGIKLEGNAIQLPINRYELLDLFAELEYKVAVEIGVNNANYAKHICKIIPEVKYYGIDPFTDYDGYNISLRHSKSLTIATDRLKNYDATLIREFSVIASQKFENNSVDFVYIDGNHDFEYVFSDILCWYPKIRKGGIISGHDYLTVKDAVDWCTKLLFVDRIFITNHTMSLSWFWVIK